MVENALIDLRILVSLQHVVDSVYQLDLAGQHVEAVLDAKVV